MNEGGAKFDKKQNREMALTIFAIYDKKLVDKQASKDKVF